MVGVMGEIDPWLREKAGETTNSLVAVKLLERLSLIFWQPSLLVQLVGDSLWRAIVTML